MFHKKLIKTKCSKKMLYLIKTLVHFFVYSLSYADLLIYLFVCFSYTIINCFVQLEMSLLHFHFQRQYNYFRLTDASKLSHFEVDVLTWNG